MTSGLLEEFDGNERVRVEDFVKRLGFGDIGAKIIGLFYYANKKDFRLSLDRICEQMAGEYSRNDVVDHVMLLAGVGWLFEDEADVYGYPGLDAAIVNLGRWFKTDLDKKMKILKDMREFSKLPEERAYNSCHYQAGRKRGRPLKRTTYDDKNKVMKSKGGNIHRKSTPPKDILPGFMKRDIVKKIVDDFKDDKRLKFS